MPMKASSKSIALVLLIAVACLSGCRKEDHETKIKPSRLIGTLYSGQSLEAVERELHLGAGNWQVLEDRRSLPSDPRPPFRIYTISLKNFNEYGQNGDLVLSFFNDQLMTTMFYPVSIGSFRAAVEQHAGISFGSTGATEIAPSTRVWVGKDASGRSYIGWIDKKLQTVQDTWIQQYDK